MEQGLIPSINHPEIDAAVEKWLEASYVHSHSERTVTDYRETMQSFRGYLHTHLIDLDGDVSVVAAHAQTWAGLRSTKSKRAGIVAPTTYNLRLATISSFYQYAKQSLRYQGDNPITTLTKAKVQKYGKARPLNHEEVKRRLSLIDRSTLEGQRDYVLLQVALNTGRRATELASLRWKNVEVLGDQVTLTFEECKGHKTMFDNLDPKLSKVLIKYLDSAYGNHTQMIPESPLWISFSDRNQKQSIGVQTIADICTKWLGVSTVHTLRHTFAHTMESVGASVSDIQARLGHESLATTGVYLARLKSAYNPYADKVASMFGLEE